MTENKGYSDFEQGRVADSRNNALELYQKRIANAAPDCRAYCNNLKAMIVGELEEMGFCTLLDTLVELCERNIGLEAHVKTTRNNGKSSIEALTYSVLKVIKNGENVDYERVRDLLYVKNNGQLMTMDECSNSSSFPVEVSTDSLLNDIKAIREKGRETHVRKLQSAKFGPTMPAAPLVGDAVSVSEAEAQKIIEAAKNEAENIRQQALEERKGLKEKIRSELEEEISCKLEEEAEELVKRHIQDSQAAFKNQCFAEVTANINRQSELAGRLEKTQDKVVRESSDLQRIWMNRIEQAVKEIEQSKTEFYNHLRDWQRDINKSKYEPIARSYTELYRIINVDRLICEQVMFQEVQKNTRANWIRNLGKNNTPDPEVSPKVIEGLNNLNVSLNTYLKRLETVLNGMGLYVFYPEKGAEFDEFQHIVEEDRIDGRNRRIKACIIPGVAKKTDDGYGDEVIVNAVVSI